MSTPQHVRQWRIVALAVVSASGRPLFLKNFPTTSASSTSAATTASADFSDNYSNMSTPSVSALDAFGGDAKKYLSPWALKVTGESNQGKLEPKQAQGALPTDSATDAPGRKHLQQQKIGGGGNLRLDDDDDDDDTSATTAANNSNNNSDKKKRRKSTGDDDESSLERSRFGGSSNNNNNTNTSKLTLQQALSAALDFEEYTETETAQLFLYAALDRLDARRATEERRSGNPFESRGYAVFDRETRTKLRAFVLVRYWGRSLPNDCHHPCQTVLTQLIQKATVAYCDPFRDVALDEPLSEGMVMDPFLTQLLMATTEMPPSVK